MIRWHIKGPRLYATQGSIQVQGKTFRVMDVQPITKSGADVIYICQLRV